MTRWYYKDFKIENNPLYSLLHCRTGALQNNLSGLQYWSGVKGSEWRPRPLDKQPDQTFLLSSKQTHRQRGLSAARCERYREISILSYNSSVETEVWGLLVRKGSHSVRPSERNSWVWGQSTLPTSGRHWVSSAEKSQSVSQALSASLSPHQPSDSLAAVISPNWYSGSYAPLMYLDKL